MDIVLSKKGVKCEAFNISDVQISFIFSKTISKNAKEIYLSNPMFSIFWRKQVKPNSNKKNLYLESVS